MLKELPELQKEERWGGGYAMVITGFKRNTNRDRNVLMKDKLPGACEGQDSWGNALSRFFIPYSYFETEWVHDISTIKIEGLLNDPHEMGKQWE